ncbi:hypothetical protein AB1Y20_022972 [Prymnesium parvum]|uniref:RCC1-like domain-containing protein n=1 Tax=Prymnesium parvum TaxID=97485 RepID=A0AB34JBU6_PRYPA
MRASCAEDGGHPTQTAPAFPTPSPACFSPQPVDEMADSHPPRRTTLLTWGDGGNGQLGHSDYSTRIMPQPVDYFKSATLVSVVCGSRSTLALDLDGRIFSWGKGEDGTLGTGVRGTAMRPRLVERLLRHPICAMAIRGSHVLALEADGQVWAWGKNDDCQLGQADRISFESKAVPERIRSLIGVHINAIACGRTHSVALDDAGALWSWGSGDDGVLGHGDMLARREPSRCAALAAERMVGVACGSRHTLALSAGGTLYSWGWGVYGQLGHGDVRSRHTPTPVVTLESYMISQLACGYRHSMVVSSSPMMTWAWGWGQHGQLGLGDWRDELLPQPLLSLAEVDVQKLCLGGRHSLALCSDGRVYTWGRDQEGQLGLGAQGACCVPTQVETLAADLVSLLDASCGWAHTACLLRQRHSVALPSGNYSPLASEALAPSWRRRDSEQTARRPKLFVMSDFEGLFGQLLGTSIQFMLFESILGKSCGFTWAMLSEELLPGATTSYLFGHLFFAIEASRVSRKSRTPVTALPQGINIVTFFAFTQLIIAPEYDRRLKLGMESDDAARGAYDTGLAACFVLGAFELLALPFVNSLRSMIPRAAMLAAIAGVSLTFIAMGFAVQIWAAPGTAIVSMLLMLLFYAGNVKLPFKVPGGILAVAIGCFLATASTWLGFDWSGHPAQSTLRATSVRMPWPKVDFFSILLEPTFYGYTSVIVPMLLVNLVNNLANIEAASAVGDRYEARSCLFATAALDLGCAFLGNPFPACVYIGHAAFKSMGCRVGYLYLNMVPTAYFGLMQGASVLQRFIPIETGVGFLLWVGLQITASGFEGDETPEGWRHGPAVAIGLLPSLSAWCWQAVSTTFDATRDLFCETSLGACGEANRTHLCSLELADIIQKVSTPIDARSPLAAFQGELSSLFLSGLYALANGYLLSAIVFSSMLVHIIEGRFDKAAIWLTLAAAASSIGVIHSPILDPSKANQLFPVMYLIGAVFLWISHALQNRAEQMRELQVQLDLYLQPVWRHFQLPAGARERLHSVSDAVSFAVARVTTLLPSALRESLSRPSQQSFVGQHSFVSQRGVPSQKGRDATSVLVASSRSGSKSFEKTRGVTYVDDLERSRPLLRESSSPHR